MCPLVIIGENVDLQVKNNLEPITPTNIQNCR